MTVLHRKPTLRMVFGPRDYLNSGIGGYATNLWTLLSKEYAAKLTAIPFRPRSLARYFYQFLVLPVKCSWWRLRRVQIVICEEALLFLVPFTGRSGYAIIHHAPTVEARVENGSGRLKSLVLKKWLRLAPLANAVICPSRTTAHELNRLGVQNVRVIPNLFDFKAYQSAANGSRWAGIGRQPYYLMVANDESRKRVDIAIRALSLIAEPLRPTLIKVGAPVDRMKRSSLERLAQEKQVEVVFYDKVEMAALISLYKNTEALLCTSSVEGFCRPIIEAQFCGVPVIATDIPVLREVAGENGALFVRPDSTSEDHAFYEGMALLSNSPDMRKALISAGQQNWKRFDVTAYRLENWEIVPSALSDSNKEVIS